MTFKQTFVTGAICLVVMTLAFSGLGGDNAGSANEPFVETCKIAPEAPSVARAWNDAQLEAIREDSPVPTVHARNLFHVSAAMFDAWAAFDDEAAGYYVDVDADPTGRLSTEQTERARTEAISYAAFVVLEERYGQSPSADSSRRRFDSVLDQYCLTWPVPGESDGTATALGVQIGEAVLAQTINDGSLERRGYKPAPRPIGNSALAVDRPGTSMDDPNSWQPLEFATADGRVVQQFTTPHWGSVVSFAMEGLPRGLPIDPGNPPRLGEAETEAEFKAAVLDVIRASSGLDAEAGTQINISPAALGANSLGADDGQGHPTNPVTGVAYEPNLVEAGDYGRVSAEFWADGPDSETPPGHWNTLANEISDDPMTDYRIRGEQQVDRLEWDAKLYFALNGALHDAAIAAWGTKAEYDYTRPISMVRYMGGQGQSTDPNAGSYDPSGLPLEPGLVELITAESSASGQRHEALADSIGQVAVRSWAPHGEPAVRWILATNWLPYQEATFVTPSFPGFVSGHSTFSRAAAEILVGYTGDEYFPGGIGRFLIEPGWLKFDEGPGEPIELQWATYYDAADEAGKSRIYGGIHVAVDDYQGRIIGSTCGELAWAKALTHFGTN